jgi:predicted ATPase
MIEYIEIKGFKSIKHLELELKPINVFIGSNGAGKSNFISFFKLLHAIFNQRLQRFVIEEKADNLLHFGRKFTEQLYGKLIFSSDNRYNNAYWFRLVQDSSGGLFIENDASGYQVKRTNDEAGYVIRANSEESIIPSSVAFRDQFLRKYLSNIQIYHFHDTSATSLLRRGCDLKDNSVLKSDGRNLPAFLYLMKMKHPKKYMRLVKVIQSVAPYIDEFILAPDSITETEIELRWKEKSDAESNFSAYQFSDGTLRFIALATVLMQPNPPGVIVIDEPELGLHPQAIQKLAALMEAASENTQLIISTQSVNLVNCFKPNDIITVDRSISQEQSIFNRLNADKLQLWLQDHTLGDLWERNIINSAQPFAK